MIIMVNDNSNGRLERNNIECEQISFLKPIIHLMIVFIVILYAVLTIRWIISHI